MLPLLIALTLIPQSAMASKRRVYPLPVAVAVADVIAIATVLDTTPARYNIAMTLQIDQVLTGESPGKTVNVVARDNWAVGDKLLVHLDRQGDVWRADDGTVKFSAKAQTMREALIATTPPWPTPVSGWSMVFVLTRDHIQAKEQLDGYAIYKNTTQAPLSFDYQEWPTNLHTRWQFDVNRDGKPVPPTAHPHLTQAEITDFFSEHGHTYQAEIEPGACWPVILQRLNSAEAGWGYKQAIGFQFWDLSAPGTYTFVATDAGFQGRDALSAPPVQVVVDPG